MTPRPKSPAPSERLRVERDGAVEIWTIDRPEVRNAVDFATCDALAGAAARARQDKALRAVVLTGSGSTFVSGGDLRELRTMLGRRDAVRIAEKGRAMCDGLRALPVPVVAALPGPAIGGGAEIAMACDLRVADPAARISFKHARMAVTTAWGTLPKLVALVGPGTASRLLLAGHELGAEEALRAGLVDAVAEPGKALEMALAWANDVAKGAPGAVVALKALIREALPGQAAHRRRERALFVPAWTGEDHHEAVEAFFAGRPPTWGAR
jgi:enoyl-CoA hydratase/carnithine racemase